MSSFWEITAPVERRGELLFFFLLVIIGEVTYIDIDFKFSLPILV